MRGDFWMVILHVNRLLNGQRLGHPWTGVGGTHVLQDHTPFIGRHCLLFGINILLDDSAIIIGEDSSTARLL